MKRTIKTYATIVMTFIMLLSINLTAKAAGEYLENNKSSVVQVVLVYTAESGERFILQSGSGVVINSNTVLTNQHVVHLNEKNLKKAKKYISKKCKLKEVPEDLATEIAIVKQDDVLIYAALENESEERDIAILGLTEETDRSSAVFGNSDAVVMANNVIAIGYPTTKPFAKEGAQLFTPNDVNLIAGVVAENAPQEMKISGVISSGNSGGALLDANSGEMIGLLAYNAEDAKKECFKVIPINELKNSYLAGTTYSDNSVAATTEEAATTEAVTEPPTEAATDKDLLNQTIDKALKLDQTAYTSDSYLIVVSCLQQAQQVQYDEAATQEKIDNAQALLQQSMNKLEAAKKTNWGMIIGIIAAVVVIIAAIVITVVVVLNMNKKKKEATQFTVLPNSEFPQFVPPNYGNQAVSQISATNENKKVNQETTLLNMAGMNKTNKATTILNASKPQISAYLIRTKTGERKQIDTIEFTVGADATRVNYYINDNEAISRCHMKIVQKGMHYFLVDLGSTNYTYLNDVNISANQEYEIKNGDHIKAADEEFVFEIM